jgi:Skp family chaperone for outer membrane proteins
MKVVRISSFAAVLAAALMTAGVAAAIAQQQPAAAAAQPAPIVIGIIDDQAVMQNSKAGKALQTDLGKQYAAFKAEISQQETALRNQAQQLQQQQASLSAEAFQKKRQELDQQVELYRKNAQNHKDQLDRASAAGLKQLRDALGKVAAEIASARGMSLVLFRSSVALSAPTFDITPDVLKRFDQALPAVSLPKSN